VDGQFYLKLFPQEDVETVARVVETIRTQRMRFVERWHERCALQFGARYQYSDQLFQESYVPYLRGAVVRISGGDAEGFVTFAAILGEHLAKSGVPFAVLVAHLQLLKESALEILGDREEVLDQHVVLTVDKLTACCVSAAADSYYGCVNGQPPYARPGLADDNAQEPRRLPPLSNFHGMVGQSAPMQQIFSQIRCVAASVAPVLVIGETGTGKELIARAVHDAGPRRDGPFIAVNCAALPRELIESEFFGYKKGAFSGAVTDHIGLFRAATGGTLLLDEITEMSPELQAKLLRALQEMSVRPVGAIDEVPLNARIIASTNRDPADLLPCGTLRSDLYYRLSVSVIRVPPLRARRDDILPLSEHQIALLNERYKDSLPGVRSVTADAMSKLCAAPWFGNVRELFNVLENAFTICRSLHIGVDDLDLHGTNGHATHAVAAEPPAAETFAQGERVLIQRALRSTGGNKRRAAQLLGISRKKLYARLAKYALAVLAVSPLVGALPARSRPGVACRIVQPPRAVSRTPVRIVDQRR